MRYILDLSEGWPDRMDRQAFAYALYLATNANAADEVIDSRALAAEHCHVHIRTITRWRAHLISVGYLMPYSVRGITE